MEHEKETRPARAAFRSSPSKRILILPLLLLLISLTKGQSDQPNENLKGRSFKWVLEVENAKEVGAGIQQFIFATSVELRQNGLVIQKCLVTGDHVLEFRLTQAQMAAGHVELVGTCRMCCQDRGIYTFDQKNIPLRRRCKVGLRLNWGNNI